MRRNTLTLLGGNVGSAVLAFALSILIGRATGETGLGSYATVLSWVFPLILLAEFGTNTLITRDVAAQPDKAQAYLNTTTYTRIILGSALVVVLLMLAPYLSQTPAVVTGLRIAAPLLLIEPSFGAYTAIFRANRVMWPIPLLNLSMVGLQILLTVWVFNLGWGIVGALGVNTLTSLARLAGAWTIYRTIFRASSSQREQLRLNTLLRRAWTFALAGVLAAVHLRMNVILLENLSGAGETGIYTAAMRFIDASRMAPQAFFDALFPALSGLATQASALDRLFRRALLGLFGFGMAVGLGFFLLAPTLVRLTYGESFGASGNLLQVAGWAMIPSLFRGGLTLYHYAQQHEHRVNMALGVMIVLRVGLGIWLIQPFGVWGALAADTLTEIAGVMILWPSGASTKRRFLLAR